MRKILQVLMLGIGTIAHVNAQKADDKAYVTSQLDKKYASYCQIAKQIWNYAELGYLESKSSALLQETLRKSGFKVESGVADIPTAFVAS